MNIQEALRVYIIEEIFQGSAPVAFDDDYDLIESGALDSLNMMKLIAYLEEKQGIQFGMNDMVPKHFKSVTSLSEFARNRNALGTLDSTS